MFTVVDYKTRQVVIPEDLVFTGPSSPWEVMMDMRQIEDKIYYETFRKIPPSVAKYLPFFPIRNYQHFVSLKEGATPLYKSTSLGPRIGVDLYFKVEAKNPTGSFKDRGTAVEMSVARELGAKGVAVASTGNMAASTSCYSAAARIPCFVFVPEDVPASKLAQVISYGGKIVQVKGNYNDAAMLAERVARRLGFYLAGDYAFRVEGAKTAAYEVVEQLQWQAPDAVIVPMGCGTNLASYYKGFKEYYHLDFIQSLPRLYGVQAEGAAAIVNSFQRGEDTVEPLAQVNTVASAIAVKNPLDGVKALDAVRGTSGAALAVSDNEMLEAQYLLAKDEGIFTESSGGAAVAAVMKLAREGTLRKKRVVCVLCGDGLKDASAVLKVAVMPPVIRPDYDAFLELYENSFFEGKSVAFVDRDEVLFAEQPTVEDLAARLYDMFETSYSERYLTRIHEMIERFLARGKQVTFSDLQDIVQDALESVRGPDTQVLSIHDYEAHTGKDRKAAASVRVRLAGDEFSGTGEGVGPVDALICALRTACGDALAFTLTGYKVDIRSRGVDAVVYVEIKLVRNGQSSIGSGTSPDIIQASMDAFEDAYNGL